MLGTAFTRTLRDAQAGDEAAFARLWSDANPLMVRYLRVIGVDDPYDAACEGWVTVVRGLPGFTGDELAWRVWILACTRMRAEESSMRHEWGSVTALPGITLPGGDAIEVEELVEGDVAGDPEHRGLGDTIAALRALPLGQGEILMLRLGGGLPVQSVSDVVGADVATVERSEARALERVGADAELLSWSLAAPPTAAELADERIATAAFRSIPRPPAWSVPRTRVVALGSVLTSSSRTAGRSHGIANAAGRSRTALLGIAVLSASAMSLGGLGAAAYVGALPDPVQKVMHDTIGAPPPTHHPTPASRTGRAASRTDGATSAGPTVAAGPAAALCRAWAADEGKGTSRQSSTAFRKLTSVAGGADGVDSYCVTVLATAPAAPGTVPTSNVPTAKGPTTTHSSGTPSGTGSPTSAPTSVTTPAPTTTSTTEGTTTGTPDPTTTSTTTTSTPNPNSPTSKGSTPKPTKSVPAKTAPVKGSPSKTSPPKTSPPKGGGKSTPAPSPTSGSLAELPLPTPVTTG